jgi:hypothetical protein
MALILLVSGLLLGAAIVWWLRLPVYPFEAAALVIVIGLFGWTWLAFLAARSTECQWTCRSRAGHT